MNKINIDDILGVKFKNHGRSIKEGFDCYGLVIEVEKRLGRILPDLDYEYSVETEFFRNYAPILEAEISCNVVYESDDADFGDIILFGDSKGRMVHIGVKLNKDDFIHCDCQCVKIDTLDNYYRKDRRFFKWHD